MGIIAQDTFTRSNTSASSNVALGWGTSSGGQTWSTTLGGGSYSISSNEGLITNCTSATFEQLGTGTIADCEALVRVSLPTTNYIMAGVTLRQTASNTAYRVRINSNSSVQGFSIVRTVAGTATLIISTTFVPTLSTFYWIRARVIGTSLYGKVWQDGTSEPASWMLSATDSNITGAGGYGLCCQSTAAGDTAKFDHLSVDDLASTTTDSLATRLRLRVANIQDIAARLNLQPNGIRNLTTRLILRRPNTANDIGTRLNLRPSVVSTQDAAVYKTQIVKAYTSAGVFIDVVRDAPLLAGFKETVNAAISPLQVVLPRAFDDFDLAGTGGPGTIAQGNIWKYFLFGPGLPFDGKLRYQGVIDAYQPGIDDNGAETVTVTLTPQSSALADHGIGGTQQFIDTDPVSIFNWWFNNTDSVTGQTYAYPLTLDGTNPATSGNSITYPFINELFSTAFPAIIAMLPINWFFRCNPDLSTTLNVTPITAQNTFLLGQHCAKPLYKQDWTQLKNVIYLVGGNPSGYGAETIKVISTTGATFDAIYTNTHVGTWHLTLDPTYTIGTEGTASIGATGSQVVTPRSMTNIVPGISLKITQISGTGTTENVTVSSTTSSTFTATFASTHSGTWSISLNPTFVVNTTTATAVSPGLATVTPSSMNNIKQGMLLYASSGAGSTQPTVVSIRQGSDLAQFGERMLMVNDSRATTQATGDTLAQSYLNQLDQVTTRTKVRIVDYRGDTQVGLGYDIESIQVGQSCRILDPQEAEATVSSVWGTGVWGTSTWDYRPGTIINQVAPIVALTYGFDYVDLEIATLQPNQDAVLIALRQRFQDFTLLA